MTLTVEHASIAHGDVVERLRPDSQRTVLAMKQDESEQALCISMLGTTAMLFEAPGALDLHAQRRIWTLAREVESWPGVREAVPGMTNLMLTFSTPPADPDSLGAALRDAWAAAGELQIEGRVVDLPVEYGGEFGPHLQDVVNHTGLSVDEVVQLHCAPLYTVYALGSHPGYCYLGGMDPYRHAAAQGAGAGFAWRRGVDRRSADRSLGIDGTERLEHDRSYVDVVLRPHAR